MASGEIDDNSYENGAGDERLLLPPHVFANSSYDECDEVKVYKRRWYVLAMYCAVCILQSLIWNTWGPIQATARAVYHWEGYVIDLMPAWGSIAFCFTMAPFAWLMDMRGKRLKLYFRMNLRET